MKLKAELRRKILVIDCSENVVLSYNITMKVIIIPLHSKLKLLGFKFDLSHSRFREQENWASNNLFLC
jgi:hypothetical protein